MKSLGYLLLLGGFLMGAYSTALDIRSTNWLMFVPSAVAALLGLILLKREAAGEARSEEVLAANRNELSDSIGRIVESLGGVIERQEQILTDDLRDEIDTGLRDDLRRFAEARESMIHLFGIQTYADIMSEFAAGERNVNRVWSASADGYRGEAHTYLGRALSRFNDAKRLLDEAMAAA